MLADDGSGLSRRYVVAWSPIVGIVRQNVKMFRNDFLPSGQSVASAHLQDYTRGRGGEQIANMLNLPLWTKAENESSE